MTKPINPLVGRPYTKKPVTIQAIFWTGEPSQVLPTLAWINQVTHGLDATHICLSESHSRVCRHSIIIPSNPIPMVASPGDYIVLGVLGEIYPCPADIFEKTYVAGKVLYKKG